MLAIPKSGYYLPNRFGLIFLQAMEDVLGANGVKATLHIANLDEWIDNFPADDLERNVDFASFSLLNAALEDIYGARGGRGIARRSAWAMFDRALRHASGVASVIDLAIKVLPMRVAVPRGLKALSIAFSKISDQQASVDIHKESYNFKFQRCPSCWGRQSEVPICHSHVGLLEQAAHWMSGGRAFRVQEIRCVARGDEACEFQIDKEPIAQLR